MLPHTKKVVLCACHVSLAGILYGLDTGSIGPVTEMVQFRNSIGQLTSTQQGLYVSCILLSASFSSLASGHISDWISRKYGILTGGILTLIGSIISATAPNFAALISARLITGVGAGQAICVTTIYLVELAPVEIRGVLACLLQLYIVLGITIGYFISFGSQNLQGSIAWRVPFIVQGVVALILCIGMIFLPFSPRWLLQKGRTEEARRVLLKIRPRDKADAELSEIQASMSTDPTNPTATFREMFAKRYLTRSMLGIFLMAFQQLTGIDAILYYAPILFQQAGFTSARASFLASGVSGIIMIAATIPAQIWVDRWGRRKPLIFGGFAMATCFLVIGSLYARFGAIENNAVVLRSTAAQWVVVVLLYLFVANFSWSWAVVGKIYACEIIPTRLRSKVCAVEQLANWLVNYAVALTAPIFLRASPSGPYFLFGLATVVSVVVCCFVPETKGKSLEEIESLFEKQSRDKIARTPSSTSSSLEAAEKC